MAVKGGVQAVPAGLLSSRARTDEFRSESFHRPRLPPGSMASIGTATSFAVLAILYLGGPLRNVALVFVVGLPLGLVLVEWGREPWLAAQRLKRARCTPIREAGGGLATIRGRIVPGECGVILSPASDRPAVWTRLDFARSAYDRGGHRLVVTRSLAAARDFLIDDGSGDLAYVAVKGVTVLDDEIVGFVPGAPSGRLRSLLEEHGIDRLSANRNTRFMLEKTLEPGAEVIAAGRWTRRDFISPAEADAPAARLVFEGGLSGQTQLVVSPWPISSLRFPPIALVAGLFVTLFSLVPLAATIWWVLGGLR